jgi:glycosyltransferase involved in cell wall biosynthesis
LKPVLLTVSGIIPEDIENQIENEKRPQADYVALAKAFPADLLDFSGAERVAGWVGRLIKIIGGRPLLLAWACFLLRKEYQLIFTDGEQVGIPLAILLKFFSGAERPRHYMIAHILSVKKKELFFDLFKIQSAINRMFVYSTFQEAYIENRWQLPDDQVAFTPFMVDDHFFSPDQARNGHALTAMAGERPLICSVGLEFRDYPTLLEAVKDLDIQVIVAAASPWSKRSDTTQGQSIPENVLVRRYSQYELRDVYAASQFLVMPLYPVDFQAGVTAILEAMAMGKAVICTRTPGQTDVIVEGETGLYVPPGDPQALHQAIRYLLDHPEEAERMGRNGRERVQREMSLDCYADRLSHSVHRESR